jgi:hypothetical protein
LWRRTRATCWRRWCAPRGRCRRRGAEAACREWGLTATAT